MGTWTTTSTISSTISQHTHLLNKTTYSVLGEEITIKGYYDFNIALCLSSITILGKPYYDELIKNKIILPTEINDFLNIKFRDYKIEQILNK